MGWEGLTKHWAKKRTSSKAANPVLVRRHSLDIFRRWKRQVHAIYGTIYLDYTRFTLVIYLTKTSFWWYKGGTYIICSEEVKNSCNHIDSSRISLINGKVKSKRHSQRKHGRIHITKSVVDFYPNFAKNSCFSFVLVIGFPDCCLSLSRPLRICNFPQHLITVWPTITSSTLAACCLLMETAGWRQCS